MLCNCPYEVESEAMSIFQEKGTVKGNRRKAPCGNIGGTEVSAKKFFVALGSMTPKGKEIGPEGLVSLGKVVGLTLIKEKSHLCGRGEVKASTARQWYRWGHPEFPDEGGKAKSESYLKLPQVVLDKIKPVLK
jgi:hypothetical protein